MVKKVLIVEDYDDVLAFMKLVIESFGYKVLTACNGSKAVEIASRELPDLILMDIALPDMNGLTATKILRNSFDSAKMPILAVTAYGNIISSEAIKAGCNEVVSKPIDVNSLKLILSHYLGR